MAHETSTLSRLVELAKENSSDKRRDLLRDITDLFMESPADYSDAEIGHFDIIMSQVAANVETELRQQLSDRLADVPTAPKGLIMQLASDEIDVAEPVLAKSSVLTEDQLVAIAQKHSQAHLQAISARPEVSERVSDEIVARGDETTLVTLAKNEGAKLSRSAMETMVEKSEGMEALQGPLVNRADLSPDLMNEMYFFVSKAIRKEILQKTDRLDPALIDNVIKDSRAGIMASAKEKADPRAAAAIAFIERKAKLDELDEALLRQLVDAKKKLEFLYGFAHLADVDPHTVRRVLADKTGEPLAICCRAAGFDNATFSKIVLAQHGDASDLAKTLIADYDAIEPATAQRVMRFWKVRKNTEEKAASNAA